VADRPTYRPTDHATRSVTIGYIYVRSTAMRPSNNNNKSNNNNNHHHHYYVKVYRDGKYSSPKCVIVNGRRERQQDITPGPSSSPTGVRPSVQQDITPGPSDYAPSRSDIMSRHRRQPAYVMSRADSAKRRQAQMTVTPGEDFSRSRPASKGQEYHTI